MTMFWTYLRFVILSTVVRVVFVVLFLCYFCFKLTQAKEEKLGKGDCNCYDADRKYGRRSATCRVHGNKLWREK